MCSVRSHCIREKYVLDKWDSSLKCLPPDRLLEMAPRLARPLVFTNGVFDSLHIGHVSYLEAASAHGSCLVVALNSDRSAQAWADAQPDPEGRPLHTLHDRARVVAALGCVSWVTWFDEDTPAALLAALRPEVYVKGGDYSLDGLPEAPLVQSWGGRVAIAPYVTGPDGTGLMQRLGHLAP